MLAIPRGRASNAVFEDFSSLMKAAILILRNESIAKIYEEKLAKFCNMKFRVVFPLAKVAIFELLKSCNLPKGRKVLMGNAHRITNRILNDVREQTKWK